MVIPAKDKDFLDLLLYQFDEDTRFTSMPQVNHPTYKYIVELGKSRRELVIPWLLSKLDDMNPFSSVGWHVCSALGDIVGEDESPSIQKQWIGIMDLIMKAWVDWGKIHYPT